MYMKSHISILWRISLMSSELTSSNFLHRRNAMHMSPPCISTGGLKKCYTSLRCLPTWVLLIVSATTLGHCVTALSRLVYDTVWFIIFKVRQPLPPHEFLPPLTITAYRFWSNIVTAVVVSHKECPPSWFVIYQTYWSFCVVTCCKWQRGYKQWDWNKMCIRRHTSEHLITETWTRTQDLYKSKKNPIPPGRA